MAFDVNLFPRLKHFNIDWYSEEYEYENGYKVEFSLEKAVNIESEFSYWFIISLGICDIVMSLISLVHLVPATAFHSGNLEY